MRNRKLNTKFTTERQRDLIARAQAGDKAAEETLLNESKGLAGRMAGAYARSFESHDFDDLFNAAMVGIWKAIHSFDLARATRFSTWCSYTIRGEIGKLKREDTLIRIPDWVNYPSGVKSHLQRSDELPRVIRSLDESCGGAGGGRGMGLDDQLLIVDVIPATNDTEAEAIAEMDQSLLAAIEALPEELRAAISLRYGLADGIEHSLQEIGDKFGYTRETARNSVNRAIARIQRALGVTP